MQVKKGAIGAIIEKYGVPQGWSLTSIDDLAVIVGGATPSRDEASYWNGGHIPWATPTDITKLGSKWLEDTEEHLTDLGLRSCSASLLPAGAILFTSRATIGAKAIARIPVATNQGFASFVPRDGVSNEFLYYYLDLLRDTVIRLGAGTTFLEVSKRDIRKVQCVRPSPTEQAAIARILDAVDQAIARTQEALEKAQRVKRGLMQQFLVSGVGQISAADRPGKYLRAGWRLVPTGELLASEPKNGISPTAEAHPPGYPTFSIAAVRNGKIDLSGDHLKYVQLTAAQADKFAIQRGDLLVVRGNANPEFVGCCGMVGDHPEFCVYPDILKRVVFRDDEDGVLPEYACVVWNHALVHNQVLKLAKTSNGTLKINTRDVKRIVLPVPPKAEQKEFLVRLQAAERYEAAIADQLSAQQRLKRGLMQDLLTGKVRTIQPRAGVVMA